MKFKKLFAFLLSASMLVSLSACADDDKGSSSEKSASIQTETVPVDSEKEKIDSEISNMEKDLSEAVSEQNKINSEIEEKEEEESQADSATASDMQSAIQELQRNYDNEHPEETIIPMLKMGLEVSFKDNIEVTYDEAASNYIINVWMDGFADMIKMSGTQTLDSNVTQLESSFSTMVNAVRMLDSDANVTFNFVSDKDKNEIFFTFYNDKMTYSFLDNQ